MCYMFGECISLQFINDISKWNTKNAKFKGVFSGCESLEYLPEISKWDTSNVINMSYMFSRCCSLKMLPDISNWNLENMKEWQLLCMNVNH